jgi:cob(I)alamin adenosyltransferase
MVDRVTDSHKHGRGDTGYSDLALGERISKGTSLPLIYWTFEELQHSLSNFIEYNPNLIDTEDLQFFEYLLFMTFAINSFLYGAGDTEWVEKFMFDSETINFMMWRVEHFQAEERRILQLDKIASEFITPKGYINRLRLKARHVEIAFWGFRDQRRDFYIEKIRDLVVRVDSHNEDPEKPIEVLSHWLNVVRVRFNEQGSILNKLSSYLYWLMRYQHVKSGGKFEEWMSEAPKLEDFIG